MKFTRFLLGLYLFDASSVDMSKLRNSFSFLHTVDDNKRLYKKRDIRKADTASLLHRRSNHMAIDKFERVVKRNLIRNNPITLGDVRRSRHIYGPSLPAIKGRTRYQASTRVPDNEILSIPKELYDDLKHLSRLHI